MTVCRRQVLLGVALVMVLFVGACSKKNVAIGGASGLGDRDRAGMADGSDETKALGSSASSKLGEASMNARKRDGLASSGTEDTMSKGQIKKKRGPNGEGVLSDAALVKGFLPIFFEYDRAVLKRQSKMRLQENARKLMQHPDTDIVIEGHTDARGSNEYNLTLGARRARSVKQFLIALGVTPERLRIISFGEEKPFCSQSKESCWQLNRRAHFKPGS